MVCRLVTASDYKYHICRWKTSRYFSLFFARI